MKHTLAWGLAGLALCIMIVTTILYAEHLRSTVAIQDLPDWVRHVLLMEGTPWAVWIWGGSIVVGTPLGMYALWKLSEDDYETLNSSYKKEKQ